MFQFNLSVFQSSMHMVHYTRTAYSDFLISSDKKYIMGGDNLLLSGTCMLNIAKKFQRCSDDFQALLKGSTEDVLTTFKCW